MTGHVNLSEQSHGKDGERIFGTTLRKHFLRKKSRQTGLGSSSITGTDVIVISQIALPENWLFA
jgi:hypothetical protein